MQSIFIHCSLFKLYIMLLVLFDWNLIITTYWSILHVWNFNILIQRKLTWETTAMRDHLSWKTCEILLVEVLMFKYILFGPVTKDHLPWKTIFWLMGLFFQKRSTVHRLGLYNVVIPLYGLWLLMGLFSSLITGSYLLFMMISKVHHALKECAVNSGCRINLFYYK